MNVQNEQYFECYKVIYNSLVSAYKDVSIVQALWELGKNPSDLPSSVTPVLVHIRELALSDLCSIIWKTSIDSDRKAATIHNLKKIVCALGKPESNKSFSPMTQHIQKDIKMLRNHHIAHADQTQPRESITIQHLFTMLDEVRGMLNDMWYLDLDNRVQRMTDAEVYHENLCIQTGLMLMGQCTMNLTKPSEKQGENYA